MVHGLDFHSAMDYRVASPPRRPAASSQSAGTQETLGYDAARRSTSDDSVATVMKTRVEDWDRAPDLLQTIWEKPISLPSLPVRSPFARQISESHGSAAETEQTLKLADEYTERVAHNIRTYVQFADRDSSIGFNLALRSQATDLAALLEEVGRQPAAVRDRVLMRISRDLTGVGKAVRTDFALRLADDSAHASREAQSVIGESLAENLLAVPASDKNRIFHKLLQLAAHMSETSDTNLGARIPIERNGWKAAGFGRERIFDKLGAYLLALRPADRQAALSSLVIAISKLPSDRAAEYFKSTLRGIDTLSSPEEKKSVLALWQSSIKTHQEPGQYNSHAVVFSPGQPPVVARVPEVQRELKVRIGEANLKERAIAEEALRMQPSPTYNQFSALLHRGFGG